MNATGGTFKDEKKKGNHQSSLWLLLECMFSKF
jgi:hypothetical protein